MATLKGRTMLLRLGGVVIDKQLDCELTITQDVSEITTKASTDRFKEYQEDFIGVTGSVNGLLENVPATMGIEDLFTEMKSTTAGTFLFSTGTATEITWSIGGIFTNIQCSFPKDGPGTFSASFQGTGVLTQAAVSA